MNRTDYPTSKDADICLILEGTYPFLGGGVSNWVYELIKSFPQYRFAAIFLGTKAEDYSELRYPLSENLVHLEAHYLFENEKIVDQRSKDIDEETMNKIVKMHDTFPTFLSGQSNTTPELFELMTDNAKVNKKHFLHSKSSWELIANKYKELHQDQSFFDYFWTVRNLHRPFWDLAKIVDHIPKVRILHSASTGYAGFLGALLQNKFQIPYIITEHGLYTKERWIELMRHYFFENAVTEQKQFDDGKGLLTIWTQFFKIMAKIGYQSANVVISLLEEYRKRQIADGAIPETTKVISYGIDFDRYYFLGKKQPNQETPVIACVGRIVPIKDIKNFIRASALIIKKIPLAEFWIVGSTEEDPEYVEMCVNLINILGLANKIKLLPQQNIMNIYPKIDLILLCSISEGSPFVILESFAVGVPVVTTNVGGCAELIYGKDAEDKLLGVAGRLVNIADPDALADSALELLNDTSAWVKSQQTGLARIKKYYGMEKFKENYGLIYQEAMTHGRHRI